MRNAQSPGTHSGAAPVVERVAAAPLGRRAYDTAQLPAASFWAQGRRQVERVLQIASESTSRGPCRWELCAP